METSIEPDLPGALRRLQHRATLEQALAFYDSLPAVTVEQVLGRWRGEELATGCPLDGMLERMGWYGKYCDSAEDVHPLVFRSPGGGLTTVNPALVPMGQVLRFAHLARRPEAARLFALLRPLMRTRRPRARLRMTEYRGVVTATMVYDALPVNDVFRAVDADTLVGSMDLRGMEHPLLFVLRRDRPHPVGG